MRSFAGRKMECNGIFLEAEFRIAAVVRCAGA